MNLILFLSSLIVHSIQSQSLTFWSTTTLFNMEGAHWELSQPMIPAISSDGTILTMYINNGKIDSAFPNID